MKAELVVPVKVRHFHKPSGHLIATIVATNVADNMVAVGVARCNKLDRPSRAKGRTLAAQRLARGLGFRGNGLDVFNTEGLARYEQEKNLFKTMTQYEFEELLATNPFNKWGCPLGAYDDEVEALRPRPKKIAKKACKKKAKSKCKPKKPKK